jgi:hypothetical protein
MEKQNKLPLPKKIEQELNRNTLFNMFGLVNLSALRARTGTRLKNETLKERIQARFGHEMATGEVEFIGEKK